MRNFNYSFDYFFEPDRSQEFYLASGQTVNTVGQRLPAAIAALVMIIITIVIARKRTFYTFYYNIFHYRGAQASKLFSLRMRLVRETFSSGLFKKCFIRVGHILLACPYKPHQKVFFFFFVQSIRYFSVEKNCRFSNDIAYA